MNGNQSEKAGDALSVNETHKLKGLNKTKMEKISISIATLGFSFSITPPLEKALRVLGCAGAQILLQRNAVPTI